MNTDTIKGKWNQLKGDVKTKWGQITDDEFTQIAGDKDKLIGKIQEKYGRSKDEVTREVHEFFNRHNTGTQTTAPKTGQTPQMPRTGQPGQTPFNNPNNQNKQHDPNRKVS
jgi:uncharacterized protein YjbJ (UPF0337 family)